MPLIIPQTLPAYKALEEENVFVMHRARAMTQDIRPLRILLVNLMPTKIATETQIARMLANSPLQVELTLLHMDSHESTHVPGAHLEAFYKTFDEIKTERFERHDRYQRARGNAGLRGSRLLARALRHF